MHQIQVDVVGAEIFKGGIESRLYVLRVMRVVPKLRRQENLVAWNTRFLDSIADRWFGAIDACRIDVTIASLECVCYSPMY